MKEEYKGYSTKNRLLSFNVYRVEGTSLSLQRIGFLVLMFTASMAPRRSINDFADKPKFLSFFHDNERLSLETYIQRM